MDELKNCPFCSVALIGVDEPRRRSTDWEAYVHPHTDDCVLGFGLQISKENIAKWNRRAEEDKHGC